MATISRGSKKIAKSKKKFVSTRRSIIALKRGAIRMSLPLHTLSSHFLSADKLKVIFGLDARVDPNFIEKFIELNQGNLKFLNVTPEPSYTPGKIGLWLHTDRYAGAIPIKSPKSSLYTMDMEIKGSYSTTLSDEELYDIISEIGGEALPEYDDSLRLTGKSFQPPIYIECEEFIRIYEAVLRSRWQKFCAATKIEMAPRGKTDWQRYALASHNPYSVLRFRNQVNELSPLHREFRQINHVLDIALSALEQLPLTSAARKRNRVIISRLRNLPETMEKEAVHKFTPKATDPKNVSRLKALANVILANSSESFCAWRLDIARLYERYIQAILLRIGAGWQVKCNPKFPVQGRKISWSLSYLEPDILLRRDTEEVVVDAKYKSHLLNTGAADTLKLKESFRADLHQIMSYAALSTAAVKSVMLLYPLHLSASSRAEGGEPIAGVLSTASISDISVTRQIITSPFNGCICRIYLVGIPFVKGRSRHFAARLRQLLEEG